MRLPSCRPASTNFGVILSATQYTRDKVHHSPELEWMHTEEHQPGSAATGGGGMETDDTTLIDWVDPSSFAAAGVRFPVPPNCLGDPGGAERLAKDSASKKMEAETLEFEAWPNLWNFWIWRMNFGSGVSTGARGPMAGMSETGGGPARVPNLRVAFSSRVAPQERKDGVTSCRGAVKSAW